MKEVLSKEELQSRISDLATVISETESNNFTPVVFVGILNGAFMFFSDLVKKITVPIEIDFVHLKSYDGRIKDRNNIRFTADLSVDIKGKHVYLVDDIIDSGHTMKFVADTFLERGATKVTPVTTILKENVVTPEALCILRYPQDAPWFIGYGMDREDGTCRNIETIIEVE